MTARENNSPDIDKWLKLVRADGIGSVTFQKLLKFFGSIDEILGASAHRLTCVNGIGQKKAEAIASSRDKFDAEAELVLAQKLGVWLVTIDDDRYPTLLKKIYDPPHVLYVRGTLSKNDNLAMAIVGSRRASIYGKEQSSKFGYLLARAGFTICSGMARGIDTAAHYGALKAQGRTIAVMGCGLANIFPKENKQLFNLIGESGACISELPLQAEPLAENFPPRNRIIAGLSLGAIIIEASQRSGALITARAAMENNREVMAVPGKIDSHLSTGAHRLIKDGAMLIESVEDVMDGLGYIGEQVKEEVSQAAKEGIEKIEKPQADVTKLNLGDAEKAIFDCLDKEPTHLDELIVSLDLAPGDVNAALVSLQLKGLVRNLPGSHFVRK